MRPQAGPALQVRAAAGRRSGRPAGPDSHRVELQQPGLHRRGRRRQEPGEERGPDRGVQQSRQGAPAEGAAEEGRPAAAGREGGRSAAAAGGGFD